jgi:hypothetical protein
VGWHTLAYFAMASATKKKVSKVLPLIFVAAAAVIVIKLFFTLSLRLEQNSLERWSLPSLTFDSKAKSLPIECSTLKCSSQKE